MEMIGAYEIIAVIGRGGMATVYQGYHRRLNRYVAIKMIHQGQVDEAGFRGRFEREAQIVANLEHAHIVPVYDYAEHEDNPYLVMKYIEGCSLKEVLAQGALDLKDVFRIMKPIAAAIDYAHGQGVLHRDIKPSNILLDKAGAAYLSDFGLARLAHAGESTLSADMVIGTPYYISPEQALGKGVIDARADLYSFGVVLYELLVGRVPYSDGTPYSIIHDHIYRELPSPSALNPHVPKAAEAVLMQALAKDPDSRYPNAVTLVDALEASLTGEHVAALWQEPRHTSADTLSKPRKLTPIAEASGQKSTRAKATNARTAPGRSGVQFAVYGIGGLVLIAVIMALAVLVLNRTRPQPPPTAAIVQPAPVTLYEVPGLSINEARANLNENPTDPLAYLAYARAQFLQRRPDQTEAVNTAIDGLPYADDPVRYVATAAELARGEMRPEAAFQVYLAALRRSEGTENYALLRERIGAAAYNTASDSNRLRLLSMTEFARQIDAEGSPLVSTMLARALLENGNVELANLSLGQVLTLDSDLPEAHLVLGELYARERRTEDARREWERVLDSADAPDWARERARSLLQAAVQ